MSEIFKVADQLVIEQAALDPINATFEGIAGHDEALTDYSPEGYAKRNDSCRNYIERIEKTDTSSHKEFIAREVMLERLRLDVDAYENNDHLLEMSFAWSSVQSIRSVFEQMSYESSDDWEIAAKRLSRIPDALEGVKASLALGIEKSVTISRRQVLAVSHQARVWAGTDAESRSFFHLILDQHRDANHGRKLGEKLQREADRAAVAFDEFSDYLIDTYEPAATDDDGVGRERYMRSAASYLGMVINPDEVYAWGWDEIARIESEIRVVSEQIKPGASLAEITAQLNKDHERWIHGEKALVEWLKGFLERAITGLDGKYFDIPAPLRQLDVRIAPPGGPANQYYVPPSEDLSRPGTYWYPTEGKSRFPIWAEISTAYHEGVPGHHLQCGMVKVNSDELSRFQRNLFISGHGEGWALYAERLMDEAGFYDRPEYKLDMLLSQYFRAARVVVDLGLHLGLKRPSGEAWTPENAHTFMLEHSNLDDAYIASEIVRYLGIPGQAISYKVGERVWLEARAQAQANLGSSFDIKTWHNKMLSLGPIGLEQLKTVAG